MTLEQTIQAMYDEYPTLFKERADCLNHLFCTIGNGYYWENGELVDGWDVSKKYIKHLEREFVNGKAFQHHKYSLRDEYLANELIAQKFKTKKDEYYTLENRVKEILREPDNKYYREPERKKRWAFYLQGYSQYAKIYDIPEDIKPDWLAGINECKELLLQDGYDLVTPIDTEKNIDQHMQAYRKRFNERSKIKIAQEEVEKYIKSGRVIYKD